MGEQEVLNKISVVIYKLGIMFIHNYHFNSDRIYNYNNYRPSTDELVENMK